MLRIAVRLIATTLLCLAAWGQDSFCPIYYNSAFSKSKVLSDHLIVDGNTGAIVDGTTKFAEGAKVQVIVLEPNPFKYLYQVRVRSQPLDAGIALQFLGLLGLPQPVMDSLNGVKAAAAPAGTCTTDQIAKWKDFQGRLDKLTTEHDSLVGEVNKLPAATKAIQDFQEATKGEELPCDNIATILQQAKDLKGLADGAPLSKRDATLIDDATKLQTDVAAVSPKAVSGDENCDLAQQKVFKDQLAKLLKDANDMKTQLDTYAKAKPELDPIYKRAQTVISSPTPFLSINYPNTTGGPRAVTVDSARQDLRATDAKMTSVGTYELTVGESHLSLSAGIGFGGIRERSIIRQAGPGDTPDTTVTRFGYAKNSQFRPSAIVQLNGHLWHFANFLGTKQPGSVGVSTGIVVSNRADNTDLEYLAGLSLGFLHNVVLITPAFHAARVQQLSGGFKIGDKVPSTLQDPLPIQKNFKPGFILTITFKVR